jgi:hypothetical protein
MTILQAYGIIDCSPIQISEALRALNLSHTLEGGTRRLTYDGLCKEQPVWPVVVDHVRNIHRVSGERLVLFVTDCRALLATTNLSTFLWPDNRGPSLQASIKSALVSAHRVNSDWSLVSKEPTTLEFVNSATKPSFLNLIQTQIYRVTPYALRKEVQQVIIAYLAGIESYTVMHRKLKSSLKLQTLYELLHLQKAKDLREAVLMGGDVEEVAKSTGFAPFELRYIQASSTKTANEARAAGKAKGR